MNFSIGPVVKGGKQYSGMKMGYSRGLPSHEAPKLLTNKKQEEFFVAALYSHLLILNDYTVLSIDVCDDDSNMGPDVKIKLPDEDVDIQITRFTLTNFLHRQNAAKKRALKIVDIVLDKTNVPFPINIIMHSNNRTGIPINKKKLDIAIVEEIMEALKVGITIQSDQPIPYIPKSEKIRTISSHFTLERIPEEMHSNFYGRDNLYLNIGFDNIGFDDEDITLEAKNIYAKKNGGKATTLLIWAEYYEILYKHEEVANILRKEFKQTTFNQVIFFSFFNTKHLHLGNPVRQAIIK